MRATPKRAGTRQKASAARSFAANRNLLENDVFTVQECPLPKLQAQQREYFFGVIGTV